MKFWHILLPLVILSVVTAMILSDNTAADDSSDSGSVEDENFRYYMNDGTLIVSDFKNTTTTPVIPSSVEVGGTSIPVTSIGYGVFSDSSGYKIESLTLPDSIEDIDGTSFVDNNIAEYIVSGTNSNYSVEGGVLYTYGYSKLVAYCNGSTSTEFTANKYTLVIGQCAFWGNSKLQSVTLPESLIMIESNAFSNAAVAHINAEGDTVTADKLPDYLISVGDYAFYECSGITSLVLGDDLTNIGANAFTGTSLVTVEIPFSLQAVGSGAFSGIPTLTSITSQSSVYECVDGVLMSKSDYDYRLITFPAGKEPEDGKYTIPSSVKSIEGWAFRGVQNLKSVVVPSSITTLGSNAFAEATSIESVTLPSNLTIIDYSAFYNATNLKSIELPSKLAQIGFSAFAYSGLESITIPASVSVVGTYCFSGCESLKTAVLSEGSSTTVEDWVFGSCTALERVEIYSPDVTLLEESLCVNSDSELMDTYTYTVLVPSGYTVPDNATDDYTELNIEVIGQRPYPYENLIGVVVCLLIVIGILYFVREV